MQDRLDTSFNKTGAVFSSPYLNFDPAILNPTGSSQFIIPEGQGEHRGKMEMAFFTIGSSVCAGGFLGGLNGFLSGIRETKNLSGNIRYSQIMNFSIKKGSLLSQTVGSWALMFSLYDTILSNVREVDDEFNVAASGLLTGATYGAPYGLRRVAKNGLIGLGCTLAYLAYTRRDKLNALVKNPSF
ncbi:mitochondrial import inner membrane translocase subunit Tim23 [Brachionus plicatilis]|uniref:Mitochondrial import inner membrane translocase subunit Tim23 n=1 Tax=Brachionus plicatilis TaxID=10195 RepID=A0A3M7T1R2_BRAPC|nr:mitochondrial import inner membrane translocase subunit Tim23 [Brachionus plicatilis]